MPFNPLRARAKQRNPKFGPRLAQIESRAKGRAPAHSRRDSMQASALRANSMTSIATGSDFLVLVFGYVKCAARRPWTRRGCSWHRRNPAARNYARSADKRFQCEWRFHPVLAFQFAFAADGDDTVCHGNFTVLLLDVRSSIRMRYSFSLSLMLASGIQFLGAVHPERPHYPASKRRKSTATHFPFPETVPNATWP